MSTARTLVNLMRDVQERQHALNKMLRASNALWQKTEHDISVFYDRCQQQLYAARQQSIRAASQLHNISERQIHIAQTRLQSETKLLQSLYELQTIQPLSDTRQLQAMVAQSMIPISVHVHTAPEPPTFAHQTLLFHTPLCHKMIHGQRHQLSTAFSGNESIVQLIGEYAHVHRQHKEERKDRIVLDTGLTPPTYHSPSVHINNTPQPPQHSQHSQPPTARVIHRSRTTHDINMSSKATTATTTTTTPPNKKRGRFRVNPVEGVYVQIT